MKREKRGREEIWRKTGDKEKRTDEGDGRWRQSFKVSNLSVTFERESLRERVWEFLWVLRWAVGSGCKDLSRRFVSVSGGYQNYFNVLFGYFLLNLSAHQFDSKLDCLWELNGVRNVSL
jgi:hypothetical protein